MATQSPIQVSSGQLVVDTSIIPFIRKSDVEFAAGDLKPYKAANFFFDDVNVSRLVQRSSVLVLAPVDSISATGKLSQGEGLYNGDSGAFGTVVDVSPDDNVYINENYITFVIDGASLSTSSYSKGDLIYQNGSATESADAVLHTFLGKVVHWDFYTKRLIVALTSGFPNTSGGVVNTFFKVGVVSLSPDTLVSRLTAGRFTAGDSVTSVDNPIYGFTVTSYMNYSGLVISGDTTTITVASDLDSSFSATDTLVRITSGSGVGQERHIQSVSGNQITLSPTEQLSTPLAADSRYSITIPAADKYGRISGIFNIPEDPSLKFRTGERLFTITDSGIYDDPDAQMKATAKYVASGILNQTQEVRFTPIVVKVPPAEPSSPSVVGSGQVTDVTTSPVRITKDTPVSRSPQRRLDPVAQTFFTPDPKSVKQNYGIFVSSIDVFFKEKPAATSPQLPVTIRLVTTVNGYPTKTIIASSTLYPNDVTATQTTDSYATILSKGTKFVFGDPVYLEPKTEYAIVVYSESPDYEVWISELGQNIIGTDRRISEQPYAGSFFRSQNASTWTPFQNQDLMFVINKAVFKTNDIAMLNFNAENPVSNVFLDQMLLHTSDIDFPDTSIQYFAKTTLASDSTRDANYFEVTPNKPYNFGQDLKNSSKDLLRRRIIKSGNGASLNVRVQMSTNDPDISPMFNLERFSLIANENKINNGELSAKNVTVTNGGGYHTAGSNGAITCNISAPQLSTGTQAEAIVLSSQIDANGKLTGIYFINAGSGYIENPTITIEDSTVAGYANAKVTLTSETSSSGGNASARYLTRKISLADGFDAGDMRVFLKAIRPFGTNIIAYYKVLSATDPSQFTDKNWHKLELLHENYSIDQSREIELQFRPALDTGKLAYVENGIDYPLGGKFKDFAIKLVLLAEDTTVVPYVKNIRVIATPAG